MTRPAEIPEDVWQLAVLHGGTSMDTQADRLIIARAIMADRAGRISFSGLTVQQADCLRFIVLHQRQHDGISPSYDEIKDGLGLGSKVHGPVAPERARRARTHQAHAQSIPRHHHHRKPGQLRSRP